MSISYFDDITDDDKPQIILIRDIRKYACRDCLVRPTCLQKYNEGMYIVRHPCEKFRLNYTYYNGRRR